MKGNLILAAPQLDADQGQAYFMRSLELCRRQGARAWELRAATDLATRLTACGERQQARELLQPLFDQAVEGFDTLDLISAVKPVEKLK